MKLPNGSRPLCLVKTFANGAKKSIGFLKTVFARSLVSSEGSCHRFCHWLAILQSQISMLILMTSRHVLEKNTEILFSY